MSANNWAECPKCRRNALKAFRERQRKAEDAYGKVSEAEYLQLKEKAKEPMVYESSSLREDYELWIDPETVEFCVKYSACCNVCGFSFKYDHSQALQK